MTLFIVRLLSALKKLFVSGRPEPRSDPPAPRQEKPAASAEAWQRARHHAEPAVGFKTKSGKSERI